MMMLILRVRRARGHRLRGRSCGQFEIAANQKRIVSVLKLFFPNPQPVTDGMTRSASRDNVWRFG